MTEYSFCLYSNKKLFHSIVFGKFLDLLSVRRLYERKNRR